MKKIILLSGGLLAITTTVILLSHVPSTKLYNNDSVAHVVTNNRIMYLNDTKLIEEYNQHLLEEKKEMEEEQKYINKVRKASKDINKIKQVETIKKIEKEKIVKNRWGITLNDDEIDLLARIVYQESRGESDRGEIAVIEVIFNRMIHKDFKGTLYEVLSKKNAFQSWKNRNLESPTKREINNIHKVLNNETLVLSSQYVYFSTSPRNNNDVIPIGNHYFCKYEK
jgi:N-acetylmuramoyl-L-alanine amidase